MAQNQNDSDSDSDKYSSERPVQEDVAKDGYSEDDYEDSPRVKSDSERRKPGQSDLDGDDAYPPEESIDVDEDEMIDVAEKIFVKIADEIFKQKVTVRQILQRHIFPAEIDGD